MTINPWRGEVEVILDNKSHVLRPTFAAINDIEQNLGIGFIALAKKISAGNITTREIAKIIECCMVEKISICDINESILRSGLADILIAITHLCTAVFVGYQRE